MELWQWALLWVVLQVIQTVQLALFGKKLTRTMVPPPPLQAPPPMAAVHFPAMKQQPGGYCRNCGSLTPAQNLDQHSLCPRCSAAAE